VAPIGILALMALRAAPAAAEVELPRQSPVASVSQQVGLTDIAVDYSSPAVKARRIWGAAVPYDKPWSISPNQPTRIRFSRDVQVGERSVPAGTYLMSMIPAKGEWTVVLRRSAGLEKVDDSPGDLVRLKVRAKPSSYRERLTFLFSDFDDDKTSLDLEWERVRVSIPISVNTTRQVLMGINELDTTWRSYANAARYMLETKKDFDAGLKYADQSLALREDWYTLWIKGALLAAKGDFKGAHEQAERASQLAPKAAEGFVLDAELSKNLADWGRRAQADKLSAR
jgi:tetratricopeptide (TPR) repeat protein